MARRILLSRSTFRAINRSVFTNQSQCFCDVYPDKPPTWLPESVLARYRNKEVPMTSIVRRILDDPRGPSPEPSTRPDSKQRPKPSPPDFSNPGTDLEHFFVHIDFPDKSIKSDRNAVIDYYIKLLAQVAGSEEEAKKRIYSVSTKYWYGFGALIPEEEYRRKLKRLTMTQVGGITHDSYEDVENKQYGGEPFVDGQAVPYDPKYHARQMEVLKYVMAYSAPHCDIILATENQKYLRPVRKGRVPLTNNQQ